MIPKTSKPCSLSISCVYYDTDFGIFEKTIESVASSLAYAKSCSALDYFELHLINNNPERESRFLAEVSKFSERLDKVIVHTGHGNIGYGRANNLVISQTRCKYHLIINPDIIIEIEALKAGLNFMETNMHVGLIAPHATNITGEIEYLAKRKPVPVIFLLRALNNQFLNKIFKKQLDFYTYKDKIQTEAPLEIELASGCFMLCRSEILKKIGGFSDKYFLYFEDFDLSYRLSKCGQIMFFPDMKIIHYGGHASKKGMKHTLLFLKSLIVFYKNIYHSR